MSEHAAMELLHKLWGQCKDGVYDKPAWQALQTQIEAMQARRLRFEKILNKNAMAPQAEEGLDETIRPAPVYAAGRDR